MNPLSQAAAMADILAAVQQHHSSDFTSNRHVTRILISPHDAPHISFLSRIGSWLKNFGVLSGIGILVAVAFRFCGLSSILFKEGTCAAEVSNRNGQHHVFFLIVKTTKAKY